MKLLKQVTSVICDTFFWTSRLQEWAEDEPGTATSEVVAESFDEAGNERLEVVRRDETSQNVGNRRWNVDGRHAGGFVLVGAGVQRGTGCSKSLK